MSRILTRWSVRHPLPVLLAAFVLTVIASAGLPRLELRTDGHALVPSRSDEVEADRLIRERFGIRDQVAIVVRDDGPDGVFNTATLRSIERLTRSARELDGVAEHGVTSLATERGFRRESGLMGFRGLLDPMPETAESLQRLRDDLRRIEVYDGILVSRDGHAAAIFVDAPPNVDRGGWVQQVRRLVAGESVSVIGAPVAESLLGHHILADLGAPGRWLNDAPSGRFGMVPVAIVLMGVIFLLAFRRPTAAVLPLLEVGICLAMVFGLMGWLGVPVYLTTAVMPVILATIGIADEIHIFRRYVELDPGSTQSDAEHRVRVQAALDEMTAPVVTTSITTAIAFLSFALSPIAPVRSFGLFTALGVMICMVISLSVIPALLVVLRPGTWRAGGAASSGRSLSRAAERVGRLAVRHRAVILMLTLVVALVCVDGVRRLRVQDSWVGGFAEDGEFARATRYFDEHFVGVHRLHLAVNIEPRSVDGSVPAEALGAFDLRIPRPAFDPQHLPGSRIRIFQTGPEPREWSTWIETAQADPEGRIVVGMPQSGGSARQWLHPTADEMLGYEIHYEPMLAPLTLERFGRLESFLDSMPGVGGVLGPARYLRTVGFMLQPDQEGSRRLPADPNQAKVFWTNYAMVRGSERRDQLVDAGFTSAVVTVFLKSADYVDTGKILWRLRDYEREHLAPHGLAVVIGGDVAVSQALIEAVVDTQVRSVLLSLVAIAAVASLLGRSLRWGIYSVLPPAFAVLINFAVMGWTGVPLGVATSMFAGMTLGIGVDYAIHLLARHRTVMHGGSEGDAPIGPGDAVAAAMGTVGPAILIDALAIAAGFGILTLSQVPANARLGGLLALSVVSCLATTMLLVPALIALQTHRNPAR